MCYICMRGVSFWKNQEDVAQCESLSKVKRAILVSARIPVVNPDAFFQTALFVSSEDAQ